LVVVLERPDLVRLHVAQAEVVEDRRLRLRIDAPAVAVGLGDPELAAVEGGDRLLGRHSARSRIAAARSHSSSVGTSARRMYPSPLGPKNEPGATRTPCSRRRRAKVSDGPSTANQRKKLALPPAKRSPLRSSTGSRMSRLRR